MSGEPVFQREVRVSGGASRPWEHDRDTLLISGLEKTRRSGLAGWWAATASVTL